MDVEYERLLAQLQWSVILTLFGLCLVGLAGMAGVDEAVVLLVRVLTLNGALG